MTIAPQPSRPAAAEQQQIGLTADGQPIYAWPQQPAPVPQQALRQHPVGAYVLAGCFAVVALGIVVCVLVAFLVGLSVALVALALCAVALTICVLVLRDMWTSSRKGS